MLHRLNVNLEKLKMDGDILAVQIWRTLRIIVSDDALRLYYADLQSRKSLWLSISISVDLKEVSIRLQVAMVRQAGCLG